MAQHMKEDLHMELYDEIALSDLTDSSIPSIVFKKRVYNEILLLKDKHNITGVIYKDIKLYNLKNRRGSDIIFIISIPLVKYKVNVILKLKWEFPFAMPRIVLQDRITKNTVNYKKQLYLRRPMVDILHDHFNIKCLCCESITCNSNWSPITHFDVILNEVLQNLSYKKRIIEIIHALKIKNKYLIDDINIEKWL